MNSTVGDLAGNRAIILEAARRAAAAGADVVLTPELSLVGYPPEDLLLRNAFYAKTRETLAGLAADLAAFPGLHVVVGHPDTDGRARYNAASVLLDGATLGTYRKHDLPNTTVFDEKRYFESSDEPLVFDVEGRALRRQYLRGHLVPACAGARARGRRRGAAGAERLAVPHEQAAPALRNDAPERGRAGHGAGVRQPGRRAGRADLRRRLVRAWTSRARCARSCKHFEEDFQIVEFDGARAGAAGAAAGARSSRPRSTGRWCWACATTSARTAFRAC